MAYLRGDGRQRAVGKQVLDDVDVVFLRRHVQRREPILNTPSRSLVTTLITGPLDYKTNCPTTVSFCVRFQETI